MMHFHHVIEAREQKPIVVVGKGHSAREIPASTEYDVAACSEAVRLCERVQYLAVNDWPAWDALTDDDLRKCRYGRLILPTFLHLDNKPSGFRSAMDTMPWWHLVGATYFYKLHTAPRELFHQEDRWIANFGRCRSISDSLIAWLLSVGYRKIMTSGVEHDGNVRYHPMFKRRVPLKTAGHRQDIWRWTLARIERVGATVERWEQSQWCTAAPGQC